MDYAQSYEESKRDLARSVEATSRALADADQLRQQLLALHTIILEAHRRYCGDLTMTGPAQALRNVLTRLEGRLEDLEDLLPDAPCSEACEARRSELQAECDGLILPLIEERDAQADALQRIGEYVAALSLMVLEGSKSE